MIILGIDPGIERTGWGIISFQKSIPTSVAYGCIFTLKSTSFEDRLVQIYNNITELCISHNPDMVSIEELFFSTNVKTAITVAQARGAVLCAIGQRSIPVVSYSPLVIKETITGSGKADKTQMQKMVKLLLKLPDIPKPDDTADALAIALTHCYRHRMERIRN